jgi:type IV secretion system protein VirD4
MIACGIDAMTRTVTPPRERVLFLLDEFTTLGPMAPILRGVALLRGYGITFWLLIQDLPRL